MAKAITGVAELAGAAALGVGAFLTGGAALAIPGYAQAMTTLVISGIASEAGAIADALTSNRGMQIAKRQPASNRGIIYGTQMVGGTVVHLSTSGHQYHRLLVLTGHACHSIQGIWIDGRKVTSKGPDLAGPFATELASAVKLMTTTT